MEELAVSSVPELLTIESAAGANGERVLSLCGELDLSNASSVLARVIDSDLVAGESLVLDLSGVTFVDSSGLIALLHAEHYLTGRSCHFALRSPTSQVRRVLELAGLADSFRIIEHDEPNHSERNDHDHWPTPVADWPRTRSAGQAGDVSAVATDG
jgi:anti-sigma B factor antagonist